MQQSQIKFDEEAFDQALSSNHYGEAFRISFGTDPKEPPFVQTARPPYLRDPWYTRDVSSASLDHFSDLRETLLDIE